jgi:RimJ/RimL family protein N-acetyltransferase
VTTRLPDEVVERARRLPLKPAPATLAGKFVRLEPLVVDRDAAQLHAVSNGSPIDLAGRAHAAYDTDALIWRYLFNGPFANLTDFSQYLQEAVTAPNSLCLCVFEQESNMQVGVVNMMSNTPSFLRIELGGIWYSPVVQRTQVNLESTYLMLRHAFGLGYRRLEWKCDSRNERSRRAAARMGFTAEGIQEQHMIVKGQNRDTAWFRMLDTEWPPFFRFCGRHQS